MVLGKVFQPAKWPAGVDDGAGIGKISLLASLRRNPWIDGAAPAPAHDFDRCFRIASGSDRPENISRIGGIDIVVNDDYEASQKSAFPSTQGDMSRLARVAAVALPQRNDLQESHSRFELPHALDVGDAALFQFIPDFGGAKKEREIAVQWINFKISNNRDDGVGPVIHALDVNHRSRAGGRSIVPRPFAKGTFGSRLYIRRWHLALQNDFRVGGNGQPGVFAGNNFKRLAGDMAGKIIFRNPPGKPQRRRSKEDRLDPAHNRDGAGLLFRPVLLGNQAGLFAG